MNKKERGITLIVLVITIIVILILVGVTVGTLTGNNGILLKAVNAKRNIEIAGEKEVIKEATILLEKSDQDDLNIKKQILQRELNKHNATVYINGEALAIFFNDSNRLYFYDDEEISELNSNLLVQDQTPGELEVVNNEYIINSIEDLVAFSSTTNGGNNYTGKTVKLGTSLDFKSELSYKNKETTDYSTFLGVDEDVTLMESLTNKEYEGFKPIGAFAGTFDGQNNTISNLYENNTTSCGLFSSISGTIQNLGMINVTLTSNQNMGAICATLSGTVKKCYVKGKVNITENGSSKYVGILVGTGPNWAAGKIEDSYSDIDITIGTSTGSNNYLGGIIGYLRDSVKRCYNKMNISSSSGIGFLTGIAGIGNGSIEECFHIGNFEIPGIWVAGIKGDACTSVKNCYSIGKMNGRGPGGIATYSRK